MKFTYRPYLGPASPTCATGILYRPVVPLGVTGTAGTFSTWALVDTGSDDTLLPLSVGRRVGATLDPGKTWTIEGIGGHSLPVILGAATLELADHNQILRWPTKIGFIDFADPSDEVNILGHIGFIEYFRVTCDGHRREVEIDVTPAFPGQVI